MDISTFFQHFGLELFGTFLLILLGNGIVANAVLRDTKGGNSGWVGITFGWGLAVFVGALISTALGGAAHLNPAVTVAFIAEGSFFAGNELLILAFFLGQIAGAALGQITVNGIYFKHLQASDSESILATHATGPQNRNIFLNLLAEFFGTFVLVMMILATAFPEFLGLGIAGWNGPIIVGITVIAIGLSLGGTTGYAINPARDLIPRIVHQLMPMSAKGSSDWKYAWIPVAGPVAAGLVGGLIFLAF
ncbi:aquaporin family protein [Spiroplasma endosymbiont of Anurida maritima]|uniref:MIP/aquaporin family protein n=1 Tax=Spiroplasma endosymbiont of Anurida maritima TaxID=2967972 RepID=UPI0036D2981E